MTAQPDENPPTESTPENDPGPNGPEQPEPEQPDTREAPEPEESEEPVQPAEAPDQPAEAKVIELHTERGALTLRPNQKDLDPAQVMALVAIGIDTRTDPGVMHHIRPFMHMCQTKGLDPWAREAYLIGRGKGDKRKYTMQTGIDGYRKMAASTGRFIRVKEVLWTGSDDDDRSYVAVDDGKGGVIMRRRWYDQWPASRGYPGSAKVTIEHYDDFGNVVETDAVADWSMYAPFNDVWEDKPGGGRRPKRDAEGNVVQELTDMWKRGYAHMLAKCAEALAHRKAFPARMSGVYTHEEMHRLDQQEVNRVRAEQTATRAQRYAEATGRSSKPIEAPADPEAPAGPIRVGDVLDEVVPEREPTRSTAPSDQDAPEAEQTAPEAEQDPATPEQRAAWLHAELAFQADVLDVTVTRLATRAVKALRKNVEEFTDAELLAVVAPLRPIAVTRLREDGKVGDAEHYASLAPADVVDWDDFMAVDGEIEHDPDALHPYTEADDGTCDVCGLREDVGPH